MKEIFIQNSWQKGKGNRYTFSRISHPVRGGTSEKGVVLLGMFFFVRSPSSHQQSHKRILATLETYTTASRNLSQMSKRTSFSSVGMDLLLLIQMDGVSEAHHFVLSVKTRKSSILKQDVNLDINKPASRIQESHFLLRAALFARQIIQDGGTCQIITDSNDLRSIIQPGSQDKFDDTLSSILPSPENHINWRNHENNCLADKIASEAVHRGCPDNTWRVTPILNPDPEHIQQLFFNHGRSTTLRHMGAKKRLQ